MVQERPNINIKILFWVLQDVPFIPKSHIQFAGVGHLFWPKPLFWPSMYPRTLVILLKLVLSHHFLLLKPSYSLWNLNTFLPFPLFSLDVHPWSPKSTWPNCRIYLQSLHICNSVQPPFISQPKQEQMLFGGHLRWIDNLLFPSTLFRYSFGNMYHVSSRFTGMVSSPRIFQKVTCAFKTKVVIFG